MNRYGKDFSKLPKPKDDKEPRKHQFRGAKGKLKRKEIYKSNQKPGLKIDEEIESLKARYEEIDTGKIEKFSDFPLSRKTLEGLEANNYESPTEIQTETIGLALQGKDILGAAKTGSGKTLAFLVPILELLFREKWSPLDGLGALIISPTRELAYQTFEVLRKIGKKHDFSAGLVIGGKHVTEESERISRTNIVVCTPGRLLQHMDETVDFRPHSLKLLVLDEADRILDMGFAQTMNAVIENLPPGRQTLLFSATQTKSVKDLARLSLYHPTYVSVHELSEYSTPSQLEQNYIVCELHEKLNLLWSFIKNHMKSKILVFFQSCKQVKFVFEVFKKLRTGLTTLSLHGGMHQLRRVAMYDQFCRKKHAVMFATDIAARGLDFPAVNWVIQMDCPEDANTYIHRAGRTARYEKDGESLLILLPTERDEMIKQLEEKKIPIQEIKPNPKKIWSIQNKMESLCASDVTLKDTAQRAFVSYLRSVFLMHNKKVFDVHELDLAAFSRSLGLAIPPRVRFLQRDQERQELQKASEKNKNKSAKVADSNEEDDLLIKKLKSSKEASESEESEEENQSDLNQLSKKSLIKSLNTSNKTRTKNVLNKDESLSENSGSESDNSSESSDLEDKKAKLPPLSEDYSFQVDDDDGDLFKIKRTLLPESDNEEEAAPEKERQSNKSQKAKPLTKAAMAKKILKKNLIVNSKVVFDEEGEAVQDVFKSGADSKEMQEMEEDVVHEGGINIEAAKELMKLRDKVDKQIFRDRVKKMHREKRLKQKEFRREKEAQKQGKQIVLGNNPEDSDEDIEEPESRGVTPADTRGEDSDASFHSEDYDDYDQGERVRDMSEDESNEENSDNVDDESMDDSSDDDENSDNDESSDNEAPQVKKRRMEKPNKTRLRREINPADLSIGDQEELALKLLQS